MTPPKPIGDAPLLNELITWHHASEKPDADTTVLIHYPNGDKTVEVGFWDSADGIWRCLVGMYLREKDVTHWAHLPQGPKA